MARSICYTEPAQASAGEVNTWSFIYTPSSTLPKGTRLKFDLQSQERPIDWELPSTDPKQGHNVIYAEMYNGKLLAAQEVEGPYGLTRFFEFVLPTPLETGKTLTIYLGAPPSKRAKEAVKAGTRAQCNAQRRRTFLLSIDPSGKGKYGSPETFSIDIRGSVLQSLRVITPSFVVRNKRFDIIVRFEDEYGNLTSNAPEDTLIELSYEHIRENLKWTLFVPEAGFLTLSNLYFNEEGVYTISLYNPKTKQTFRSSPIKCFAENTRQLFWGLLHGESDRVDSTENIDGCVRSFRDDMAFNFFASSCFEDQEETSNELWKEVTQTIEEFDETDRFVTFLGFQWCGSSPDEGLRQFIYLKNNKPILRKKEAKYNALKKIYKSFSPKELIAMPCFTMGKGLEYDFKAFDPQFERVVEIYNAWGSSETTKKEGNPLPIFSNEKHGVQEYAEGAIQRALARNCRFGFVAGGLDDRGVYSGFYEGDQEQYNPGMTAIIATEHSRTSLFEALYERSCYATTGERIIVGLSLAGATMGRELSTATKPGLLINRHLTGYVAGTKPIKSVEIIRNGKVIQTFSSDNYYLDFTFDDMTPLDKVAFVSKDKEWPPFVYYYIRVTQADGHMAWGSPIWVDLLPPNPEALKRPAKTGAAAKPKLVIEEEIEEEEDEDDLDL